MRLRLVVEELFVNTVMHGHGGDSDAPVDISILLAGDRVVLTYVDVAPPFDPFAEVHDPAAEARLEDRRVGGLGVFLVRQFVDELDYRREDGRNHLRLRKRVGARAASDGGDEDMS